MKGVIVHGVLATAGLLLAYSVWTAEATPERGDDTVTVVDCADTSFRHAKLVTKSKTIELERREEGGTPFFWIRSERTPERGERETSEFVGSEAAGEYIKELLPLEALRSLGDLADAQLDEVGLKTPETTFTLECGGQTRAFSVGGSTYGASDRYARASSGGPVFLFAADTFRKLDGAESQLMQRELWTFPMTDVEALVLRADASEKRLQQRNRQEARTAAWVDAADPERVNELYGNWIQNRLVRLRVQKYLAPGAEPSSVADAATVVPVMRIRFVGANARDLGEVEVVRIDGTPARYFAKSPATRAWVEIARTMAVQLEDDGRTVLGLDPIERAPEAPAVPTAPPAAESSAPESASALREAPAPSTRPAPIPPARPAPSAP